jgi:hypothetical protein
MVALAFAAIKYVDPICVVVAPVFTDLAKSTILAVVELTSNFAEAKTNVLVE